MTHDRIVAACEIIGTENAGVWIESQCRQLGVSVSRIAREARIDRSTIFRWKRGDVEPYWGTLRRVKGVIDSIWEQREDKAG